MSAGLAKGCPTTQQAWGERASQFDPPGNYLAFKLKAIGDRSSSVFGKSVKGQNTKRWITVTKDDFHGIDRDFYKHLPRTAGYMVTPSSPLKLGYVSSENSFNGWRVPARLTSKEERSASKASRQSSRVDQTLPQTPVENYCEKLPDINVNDIAESQQSRAQTARSGRSTRNSLQSRSSLNSARLPETPQTAAQKQSKSILRQEVMKNFSNHDVPTSDEHWFKGSNDLNNKVVESAKGTRLSAGDSVARWLHEASPRDRKLASIFLESDAGQQLVGKLTGKEKAEQVLQAIKQNRHLTSVSIPEENLTGNARLHHLRLLTPETRRNYKQFQTWHHLPPPNRTVDPVINPSAIYTQPNKPVPLSFSIHPDWGEN